MIRRTVPDDSKPTTGLLVLFLVGLVFVVALAPAVARVPTNSGTSSTVSGTVVGPDGDPLTGDFVWQFDYDTYRPTVTDENGSFAMTGNGTIAFTQRTTDHYWERDGVTDMYAIGQLSGNISKITVPAGHVLDVRVLDASGRPVSGANVSIRDYDADSDASVSTLGETDPNGFYRAHDAPFTGIEVAGNVSVVVQPALTDLRFVQRRYHYDITVTNETTLTIRLDEGRETIDVFSELTGYDGVPASGTVHIRTGRVFTSSNQPASRLENRSFSLNDSGGFETTVPFDDRMTGSTFHWLTFSQDGLPRDGVPDLFAIEQFEATESHHFARRLPPAYATNVTVRDDDGTTVETETSTVSHAFESVGSHTVRVIAFDGAGNADAVTMDVSVTETPAIRAGSDRWFVNESEATLPYAVANADGATAEYAIDGGAWRPASSPLSVTGLDSGNHSVAFRLVNESGPLPHESASDVATLTVDTDPPELAVEATRADVRPGTPLRVTVTDTAISDVFYRTNRSESGRLDFADARGSATVALDTSGWAARPTELVVTARDRAGNVRRERVGFDFTPDLEIESFRPANGTQVSNVVVSATFARGTASLFVDGERVSEEVSGTSLEAPLSDLAPGNHTARLVVAAAGHEVSATRTFEVVAGDGNDRTGGGGGGGGGGGFSEPIVDVVAGDDGVAVDLLNGREGVTAWAELGDESAASVRFTRFGVTFDQNDASTALTLAARTPTERSPPSALAVLDVEKRYVRTGDVASASIRFSLAPGGSRRMRRSPT